MDNNSTGTVFDLPVVIEPLPSRPALMEVSVRVALHCALGKSVYRILFSTPGSSGQSGAFETILA